jgi:hypothetical protein
MFTILAYRHYSGFSLLLNCNDLESGDVFSWLLLQVMFARYSQFLLRNQYSPLVKPFTIHHIAYSEPRPKPRNEAEKRENAKHFFAGPADLPFKSFLTWREEER